MPHVLDDARLDEYFRISRRLIQTGSYRSRSGYSQRVARLTAETLQLSPEWEVLPLRSGTDALTAALALAGVGPSQLVAAPDLAYHAVGSAILQVGARPVWVDVGTSDWNLDPSHLAHLLSTQPIAAVLAVDNYGTPCAWPELSSICRASGTKLILDRSESLGILHPSGEASRFADLVTLSYSFTKPIHAAGAGGALCGPSRILSPAVDSPSLMLYQRRLPELNAAYLFLSWPDLQESLQHLRLIYTRYCHLLTPRGLTPQAPDQPSTRLHAPFLLQPDVSPQARDLLIRRMAESGVEVRPMFPAQSVLFEVGTPPATASGISARVICLPTGAGLPLNAVDTVVTALSSCLSR